MIDAKEVVMKKVICFLPYLFFLTSCKIHYANKWEYDVHWWVIAIPAVIILGIVYLILGKSVSKDLYVCPKCNHEFYPNRFTSVFSIHETFNEDEERVLRCPKCKRKGFCKKK